MMHKKINPARELYWFDDKTKRYFARVVAGISWPFKEKPGWIVVLAQDDEPNPPTGKTTFRILDEQNDPLVHRLLLRLREVNKTFLVERAYGDLSDESTAFLYREHNRTMGEQWIASIGIDFPPLSDQPNNLQAYLQMIDNRTKSGVEKTLFFGEGSQVATALQKLDPQDATGDVKEWPEIAALGFGLAALEVYKPAPFTGKPQRVAQDAPGYDPLTWEPEG